MLSCCIFKLCELINNVKRNTTTQSNVSRWKWIICYRSQSVPTAKDLFRVSSTDAEYGQSHTLQASTEQDKKQWLNEIRSVIPHPENYKTYLWCHARFLTSRNALSLDKSAEKNLNATQRVTWECTKSRRVLVETFESSCNYHRLLVCQMPWTLTHRSHQFPSPVTLSIWEWRN